jgi:hypothetical protein
MKAKNSSATLMTQRQAKKLERAEQEIAATRRAARRAKVNLKQAKKVAKHARKRLKAAKKQYKVVLKVFQRYEKKAAARMVEKRGRRDTRRSSPRRRRLPETRTQSKLPESMKPQLARRARKIGVTPVSESNLRMKSVQTTAPVASQASQIRPAETPPPPSAISELPRISGSSGSNL